MITKYLSIVTQLTQRQLYAIYLNYVVDKYNNNISLRFMYPSKLLHAESICHTMNLLLFHTRSTATLCKHIGRAQAVVTVCVHRYAHLMTVCVHFCPECVLQCSAIYKSINVCLHFVCVCVSVYITQFQTVLYTHILYYNFFHQIGAWF